MRDYIHDRLTDLVVSYALLFTPINKPEPGEWCIELSSYEENRDTCIGIFVGGNPDGECKTVTVGGCEVTWHNAMVRRLPQNNLRDKNIECTQKFEDELETFELGDERHGYTKNKVWG